MLEIKFKDSQIFRSIFSMLEDLLTDVNIIVSKDGLTIKQLDQSHICLVKVMLSPSDFTVFNGPWDDKKAKAKDVALAVSSATLVKVLKRADANDEITFTYDADKAHQLNVILKKKDTEKSRRHKVSVIEDYEEEAVDTAKIESGVMANLFTISNRTLDAAIKDGEIYSEYLTFNVVNRGAKLGLMFSAIGTIGEMEFDVEDTDIKGYKTAEGKDADAALTRESGVQYGIKYLTKILKASSFATDMQVEFGQTDEEVADQRTPVRVTFFRENSSIRFHLAPRAEESADYVYEASAEDAPAEGAEDAEATEDTEEAK